MRGSRISLNGKSPEHLSIIHKHSEDKRHPPGLEEGEAHHRSPGKEPGREDCVSEQSNTDMQFQGSSVYLPLDNHPTRRDRKPVEERSGQGKDGPVKKMAWIKMRPARATHSIVRVCSLFLTPQSIVAFLNSSAAIPARSAARPASTSQSVAMPNAGVTPAR